MCISQITPGLAEVDDFLALSQSEIALSEQESDTIDSAVAIGSQLSEDALNILLGCEEIANILRGFLDCIVHCPSGY